MSKSPVLTVLSSRWVRNLLAVAGTVVLTFLVFRGVAAFNDALRLYGSLPVAPAGYSCPQGYALVTVPNTTQQECIPAPSETKGVVAVGIYQPDAKKAAQKPAAAKPPAVKTNAAKAPAAKPPAAAKPTTPP